jgi:Ni/Co efflux regulator RcnB
MNKVIVVLLAALFAAAGLTRQKATAQEKQEKTAPAAKRARWHGRIVRINKDLSTLDVRRQGIEKKIYYDSSTKWTQGGNDVKMSRFKEEEDVICLGTYDEMGKFHATQIELQLP